MKFRFKTQQYQTDAVDAIVNVFSGQPYREKSEYTFDKGVVSQRQNEQMSLFNQASNEISIDDLDVVGFANAELELSKDKLLSNIKEIQEMSNIKVSDRLFDALGKVELDVEMETGTGKTYVYIKSMFELNKRYGFSKFIIVVPSIAIREGVFKTFKMTEDHFMDLYGKKARYFIYDSKKLDKIEQFSSSNAINVMIINIQAFNARGADARRIYEELDEFQSRRPIDVIKKNRPILILDEPQKMSGEATQESLLRFNPLFSMNFSATHRYQHNLIYVLDAVDAYNKKLVKKIEVKGFTLKNLKGTNGYLYLQDIVVSANKPPVAKIEFEIAYKKSGKVNRETRNLNKGDNIYQLSNELEEYKNQYVISEINPLGNTVTFLNGEVLQLGDAVGNVNENDVRRIQIRETIKSHFEKEKELYKQGIKVLSLFFIDEVSKYRQYDEDGNQVLGEYGKIFEEEYIKAYNEEHDLFDTDYNKYLENTIHDVSKVHNGYFSIDKKGRSINSEVSKASGISDDISAYDLILKDKERLLSFDEPTRFIFSHSALREGWDNPNIFQICTLKNSGNDIQRRQEVGRGLRICVNSNGDRMDSLTPNIDFFDVNKLTVIASESYEDFVDGLQKDIKENLYARPMKATKEFFANKLIKVDGKDYRITSSQATAIYRYLLKNDYIDNNDKPTDTYKNDVANNSLKPMDVELEAIHDQVHQLIQSIYDGSVLDEMISNGRQAVVQNNEVNGNFEKKEFKNLWKLINHKYAYLVDFDSNELIKKSIDSINANLSVNQLTYTITTGEQKDEMDASQVENLNSFKSSHSSTKKLLEIDNNDVKYDLVGKVAEQTYLRRKTVAKILMEINPTKFDLFKANPEEFINNVSKLINDEKASLIIDHITYNEIDGTYDSNIFTESKNSADFKNAYKALKCIKDYVFVDGINKDNSVERRFAEDLDNSDEVVVYAKMPKSFYIPTPVGNYSPDWAIAFKEGTVRHIYFLAETKGSMDSLQLRGIEKAKIECAKKLFNKMSNSEVRYEQVSTYADLMNKINGMK